jgi:hypothetical protein
MCTGKGEVWGDGKASNVSSRSRGCLVISQRP